MTVTQRMIDNFCDYLSEENYARNTVSKYRRDLGSLAAFLQEQEVTKGQLYLWRDFLLRSHAPTSVNSMLAAANRFFAHYGRADFHLKFLQIQRKAFCDKNRELSRTEYQTLVKTAYRLGKERIGLVVETLCSLGLRVSELQYITLHAVQKGCADIRMKGKIRTVLISEKLRKKLLHYARKQKIAFGELFVTKSGRGLSRTQIWQEMKALCRAARVNPKKVFPHNLRHLFARSYYEESKNLAKLADILGHTSLETTRLYLISSGTEYERQLNRLHLVL